MQNAQNFLRAIQNTKGGGGKVRNKPNNSSGQGSNNSEGFDNRNDTSACYLSSTTKWKESKLTEQFHAQRITLLVLQIKTIDNNVKHCGRAKHAGESSLMTT